MKRLLTLVLLLCSYPLFAQPHLVSDPIQANSTACAFQIDATAQVSTLPATVASLPLAVQTTMPGGTLGTAIVCWYDLKPLNLPPGSHIGKAAPIVADPLFGTVQAAWSNVVSFTVPAAPSTASTLRGVAQ